ncbi:MAG: sigma 54-interacting transcriptional regulator [Magnetococcales bacterium]|nr:sigma 54-interacting transcriptional regulator [Magnetococcales bacterium]
MSAYGNTCTLPKNCVAVLAGMEKRVEQQVRRMLGTLAPLKTLTLQESVMTPGCEESVGVLLVPVGISKESREKLLGHFDQGHWAAILVVDAKKERFSLLSAGTAPGDGEEEMYQWENMREWVAHLLQLASLRLESFLLRETFNAVTMGIQEAVIVVDPLLNVRSINPAARTQCRFITAITLGSSLETIQDGCVPQVAGLLRRVVTTRKAEWNLSLQCPDTESAKVEIRISATPLMDPLGHCHGATAVILERTQLAGTEESPHKRQNFYRMIGASPPMQEVYGLVESLASMDTTTLITGESGTGKEMVAEALHMKGTRSHGPLVKVNCSALSETLLESELFGHVKGAFTGAIRDRPGRFEVATGGTLFLDEIGDISLSMQTRLLRVLQEKELERVGDARTIKVDVRVVAATNKNLADLIALGKFREDLYFRLNVVEIALPPLRKRLEDIPLLASHFIQKFNHKYSKAIVGVQEAAMELFLQYHWPGNIRELENAIEHAFVVCRQGMIRVKHLPKPLLLGRPCADPSVSDPPAESAVEKVNSDPAESLSPGSDKETILRALEAAHWNRKKAALLSGISRSTFYRKMEKYGIR